MSHPRKRKTQSQFVLDPKQLVKQSVIGCTVQPSRDDPSLDNGVALTALVAFDEKYVRFEDIDGMGEPSYRYWKDVFLIVAWNDTSLHQPALRPGDKCFALFQNVGGDFTTVYYNAVIRGLPQSPSGQIVIDFLDGTKNFTNISIPTQATVGTKNGDQVVPTVIRRVCAENSNPQKEALHKYRASHKKKQRSNKTQKHAQPKPPPTKPPKTTTPRPSVASTNTTASIPNASSLNRSQSASASVSQSATPLKKPASSRQKRQAIKSDSDSDSPIVPPSHNVVNNMNIGVGLQTQTQTQTQPHTHRVPQSHPPPHPASTTINSRAHNVQSINPRKRKYEALHKNPPNIMHNASNPNVVPVTAVGAPPPIKRQRSGRRGAQKLKIPAAATTDSSAKNIVKPPPTIPSAVNTSSPAPPPTIPSAAPSVPHSVAPPVPPRKKKRTITFKRKPRNLTSPAISAGSSTPSAPPVSAPKPLASSSASTKIMKNTNVSMAVAAPPAAPPSIPATHRPRVVPPKQPSIKKEMTKPKQDAAEITYNYLKAMNFAEGLIIEAVKLFAHDTKRAVAYCQQQQQQQQARERSVSSTVQPVQYGKKRKLKKMWGENYDVAMPKVPDGFQLFEAKDLYLSDFTESLRKIVISQQPTKNNQAKQQERTKTNQKEDIVHFVSGLGIQHKWCEPREIGEIVIGPFVPDIDIMTLT